MWDVILGIKCIGGSIGGPQPLCYSHWHAEQSWWVRGGTQFVAHRTLVGEKRAKSPRRPVCLQAGPVSPDLDVLVLAPASLSDPPAPTHRVAKLRSLWKAFPLRHPSPLIPRLIALSMFYAALLGNVPFLVFCCWTSAVALLLTLLMHVSRRCPLPLGRRHTLALLGLDNTGKTTLLGLLLTGRVAAYPPTVIPKEHLNVPVTSDFTADVVDLGGQWPETWPLYYRKPRLGLVFCVDANDASRLREARERMERVLEHPDLATVPCAVLGNKMDLVVGDRGVRLTESLAAAPAGAARGLFAPLGTALGFERVWSDAARDEQQRLCAAVTGALLMCAWPRDLVRAVCQFLALPAACEFGDWWVWAGRRARSAPCRLFWCSVCFRAGHFDGLDWLAQQVAQGQG